MCMGLKSHFQINTLVLVHMSGIELYSKYIYIYIYIHAGHMRHMSCVLCIRHRRYFLDVFSTLIDKSSDSQGQVIR